MLCFAVRFNGSFDLMIVVTFSFCIIIIVIITRGNRRKIKEGGQCSNVQYGTVLYQIGKVCVLCVECRNE